MPGTTIFFPHYLINGMIFEKKLPKTKCVFWFSPQLLSETFLILRRNARDMIKHVCWLSCKVPAVLSRLKKKLIFSRDYRQNNQISNLMKICSVGAKLFHGDRRTDKTKLIVAFRNSTNVPQSVCVITYYHRILFCPVAEQPKSGLGRLTVEVSRSHTHTQR